MKTVALFVSVALLFAGCVNEAEVDTEAPFPPQGIRTISLDGAVEISWYPSQARDIAGYKVWVSGSYDGQYELIGRTTQTVYVDEGGVNGVTYYYAVSAYDRDGNESELSKDVVYDTPRPEGYDVTITDRFVTPSLAGYDFSTYSRGQYDDEYTDVFFENISGIYQFSVWSDTDIQDMGYTASLDEISSAPLAGWAPSGTAEAIVGHTYVIWTWDDHYAKVRVKQVGAGGVVFDWAYQTAEKNPELSLRKGKNTSKRNPLSRRPQ